jgi:hypothetical protein
MEILVMSNGQTEIISDEKDLIEFIGRLMGYEVKTMIEAIVKKPEKVRAYTDSDYESYERQVEENVNAFEELANLLDTASSELKKERFNRKELKRLIERMDSVVSNQI